MQQETIASRVLVHDLDQNVLNTLRGFCDANNLIGLKVQHDSLLDVLKTNIDLGAVFLSEEPDETGVRGIELAEHIHQLRAELPIFLRVNAKESQVNFDKSYLLAGTYQINEMQELKELIEKYLFSRTYPSQLVRGIMGLTAEAYAAAFHDFEIVCGKPFLVKDKIAHGELLSLMPIESSWCRGYMMLQCDEANILNVIAHNRTLIKSKDPNFRDVNAILAELSNMTWGRFRSRFISNDLLNDTQHRIHVPIIVNHGRKYITFGSNEPHLSFCYTLVDRNNIISPFVLKQQFVFSLSWVPEKFDENQKKLDAMIKEGELELFC